MTFYDLKRSLAFGRVAGAMKSHDDLFATLQLLQELKSDCNELDYVLQNDIDLKLPPEMIARLTYNNARLTEACDHDIVKILAYMDSKNLSFI